MLELVEIRLPHLELGLLQQLQEITLLHPRCQLTPHLLLLQLTITAYLLLRVVEVKQLLLGGLDVLLFVATVRFRGRQGRRGGCGGEEDVAAILLDLADVEEVSLLFLDALPVQLL